MQIMDQVKRFAPLSPPSGVISHRFSPYSVGLCLQILPVRQSASAGQNLLCRFLSQALFFAESVPSAQIRKTPGPRDLKYMPHAGA